MGSLFVMLEPWNERKSKDESIDAIIAKANEIGDSMQEPIVFSLNPPAIPGLGMTSGLEMQLLDINALGSAQQKAVDEIRTQAARIRA